MFVWQLHSISCLLTMSILFCATYCTLSRCGWVGSKNPAISGKILFKTTKEKPPTARSSSAVRGAPNRIRTCGLLIRSASQETCEASKIKYFTICNNNEKWSSAFLCLSLSGSDFVYISNSMTINTCWQHQPAVFLCLPSPPAVPRFGFSYPFRSPKHRKHH